MDAPPCSPAYAQTTPRGRENINIRYHLKQPIHMRIPRWWSDQNQPDQHAIHRHHQPVQRRREIGGIAVARKQGKKDERAIEKAMLSAC